MASDQFYLKDKLIFSFLSLLVWNALGNYRLFWLCFESTGLKSVNVCAHHREYVAYVSLGFVTMSTLVCFLLACTLFSEEVGSLTIDHRWFVFTMH